MKKVFSKIGKVCSLAFIFLSSCAAGVMLCITLFSGFFALHEVLLGMCGIILCLYISIIVHEAGHLIFGLLSGYRFSSFRIGSLMWIKQNGKTKLRRHSIAGTGGQCLMVPPVEAKNPVILYNLGGVIANIILALVFLGLYFITLRIVLIALVFLISAILSFILAMMNGLPLDVGGIANDGMNAIHLSKNPDAAVAFRNQLLMNAAQSEGVRLSEMPEEWFHLPEGADMQNVHCASVAVFAAGRPLDRGDIITAEKEITKVLHSRYNIIGLHVSLLTCDLIYCKLINSPSADISYLLSADVRKIMKMMKAYPAVIRTEYTLALLFEKNEKRAKDLMSFFNKSTKKFPYFQEIEAERNLMAKALEISKSVEKMEQSEK